MSESKFNKKIGAPIDKKEVDKLKTNWKKTGIETRGNFFGSDRIQELINRPGAVGIFFEYGISDDKKMQPVMFALDSEGRIIKDPVATKTTTNDDSGGVNASAPCPPICPQ